MTESDLLAMREVQAKAEKGPWKARITGSTIWLEDESGKALIAWLGFDSSSLSVRDRARLVKFVAHARTDWPRVTEWAIRARRLLEAYRAGRITDGPMLAEVNRLLGE